MATVSADRPSRPLIDRLSFFGVNPGVMLGFIFLLILLFVTTPVLHQPDKLLGALQNLSQQVAINAIISVGMTFVIITAGIDLSVGSILGLVGTLTALTLTGPPIVAKFGNGAMVVATVVGLLAGSFIGFLNGAAVAWLKMQPFIVTLATMWAVRGAAEVLTNGSPVGIVSPDQPLAAARNALISDKFSVLGMGYVKGIPISAIIAIVVIILAHILLTKTVFGRHVFALGGNPEAARLSGVNINKISLLVYTISGGLAGLAAILMMSKLLSGQPTAGQGYELYAIAAVVVGGTSLFGGIGSIMGTVIGALIIQVISMGLNLHDISSFWQQIVTGTIILVAVLLDEVLRRRRG